jgi:hypothetical protein
VLAQALPSQQVLARALPWQQVLARALRPVEPLALPAAWELAHRPSAPLERAQLARSLPRREKQQNQGQRLAWYAWWMAPRGKTNCMLDGLGPRRNQAF